MYIEIGSQGGISFFGGGEVTEDKTDKTPQNGGLRVIGSFFTSQFKTHTTEIFVFSIRIKTAMFESKYR